MINKKDYRYFYSIDKNDCFYKKNTDAIKTASIRSFVIISGAVFIFMLIFYFLMKRINFKNIISLKITSISVTALLLIILAISAYEAIRRIAASGKKNNTDRIIKNLSWYIGETEGKYFFCYPDRNYFIEPDEYKNLLKSCRENIDSCLAFEIYKTLNYKKNRTMKKRILKALYEISKMDGAWETNNPYSLIS